MPITKAWLYNIGNSFAFYIFNLLHAKIMFLKIVKSNLDNILLFTGYVIT